MSIAADLKGTVLMFWYWVIAILESLWGCLSHEYKMRKMNDDIVLITGAAGGFGKLLCLEFTKLGAKVVAVDMNQKGLNDVSDFVEKETGSKIACYTCDLCDRKAIYSLADQVFSEVGVVTVLMNNAGIVQGKTILNSEDQITERLFNVNTLAPIWLTKAFLPRLIESGRTGNLVYVASFAGWFNVVQMADYCASKAACISIGETMDLELHAQKLDTRIKVTCVCPYLTDTGILQGFRSKFHFLLPVYQPAFVVDQIVQATRRGDLYLALPKLTHILRIIKVVLPDRVMKQFAVVSGLVTGMDTFVDNRKKQY